MSQLPEVVRRQYSEDERRHIVAYVLDATQERGLQTVCDEIGVPISTVLQWVRSNPEWDVLYESNKNIRSRVLVETAISQYDEKMTSEQAKSAESVARMRLKMAAILNPSEFSDRAHAAKFKHASATKPISFVLNFAGNQNVQPHQITITTQPEDGD